MVKVASTGPPSLAVLRFSVTLIDAAGVSLSCSREPQVADETAASNSVAITPARALHAECIITSTLLNRRQQPVEADFAFLPRPPHDQLQVGELVDRLDDVRVLLP